MALLKDRSQRLLGDVVRAGAKDAKRLGYVVDTGKYGRGYGWLWSESQGGAFVGIHGDFLAYSEKTQRWYEIPTRVSWGDLVLYSMGDDRPLTAALERLPEIVDKLAASGGLDDAKGPGVGGARLNVGAVLHDCKLLRQFPGFEEAFARTGFTAMLDEAQASQDEARQTGAARAKLLDHKGVNGQVWLAAHYGYVHASLVSRYRLEFRKRVESFATGYGIWNADGQRLNAQFEPLKDDGLWLRTQDAKDEVKALIRQCIGAAQAEWQQAYGDVRELGIFCHAAAPQNQQELVGVPAWMPGAWVKTGGFAGFAVSPKVEGHRALGLVHLLNGPQDWEAFNTLSAAPRRLMDAHVGGRKVQVLACILDLQPGRYDEIDAATRQAAQEAFERAGVSKATLDKVLDTL